MDYKVIMISFFIGILSGYIIHRICEKFIKKDKDRLKDYNLNDKLLIIVVVLITEVVAYKFPNFKGVSYIVLLYILLIISIIDYYTHYVYLNIVIVSVFITCILTTFNKGNTIFIREAAILSLLFFISSIKGKWYGDVQTIFIIGTIVGPVSTMVITLIAAIIGVSIGAFKRTLKEEIAFCPLLTIGYLTFLVLI